MTCLLASLAAHAGYDVMRRDAGRLIDEQHARRERVRAHRGKG
jgi:hypothetical protein